MKYLILHDNKPNFFDMERDICIDWLKMFAILLITNSHFAPLYVKGEALATGGAFGVALFFFCSGFTLFLKPMGEARNFFNWYKRRILRIYPSVFAFAVVAGFLFDKTWRIDLHRYDGGWFIDCIMVYYILIFFIGVFFQKRLGWMLVLNLLVLAAFFLYQYKDPDFFMYKDPFQRLVFFTCMLLGAMMGQSTTKPKARPLLDISMLVLCTVCYYGLLVVSTKYGNLLLIQYLSVFPLLGVLYYFYKIFSAEWAKRVYRSSVANVVIRVIGGLCLEIYLVQFKVITVKLNHLFPLNLLLVFIAILGVAYLTRCLARFLLQTFNEAPYNWKKIISIY